MNATDIILLICLVPSVIRGFMKGFLTQALELIALVVGAWVAYHFSWAATRWAQQYVEASAAILHIVLFVLLLILAFYLLHFVGKALLRIIRVIISGGMDKLLGVVFGLMKAVLITGLFVIVFHTLNTQFGFVSAKVLEESVLYGPIKDFAYAVFPYFKQMLSL